MKTYTESDPKFSDSIQITETTDPAHADNINAAPKQLLQNTLALRKQAGELNENLALHTHAWSAITSKPNTFPASAHTHDGITQNQKWISSFPGSRIHLTTMTAGIIQRKR